MSSSRKLLVAAGDIVVFGELPTRAASLHDMLARLSWYLTPSLANAASRVIFFSDIDLPEQIHAPAYIDPATQREYTILRKHATVLAVDAADMLEGQAAAVFAIRKSEMRDASLLAKRLGLPQAICVDPGVEQYESSKYLRFGSTNGMMPANLVATYKARFAELKTACNGRTVGIFGTGPTLEGVDPQSFADSFNIATNSMVMNDALLAQLRPRVIVASDPIFHAGCSTYAGSFRAKLIEQVKRYDAYFVFPSRDYHIYERHLAEIADRLIGVPMLQLQDLSSQRQTKIDEPVDRFVESTRLRPVNDAMTEQFYTFVSNNVMTFFLLPIASSISRSAIAAGFDGRNADASTYFWDHAPSSQLGDKMADIKECHPAFFEIDYNEYLSIHTERLTAQLHYLEQRGFEFHNITPSYIPVLAAHHRPHVRKAEQVDALERRRPKVSIIMPNRDRAEFLARAIDSIIAQDFQDWELLVIDNLSTDKSLAIAQYYAGLDARIRVLVNSKPGVSASRNLGLDESIGEYICFLDSDDELWSRSLSARVAKLDEGASLAFGLIEFINGKGDLLGQTTGARANAAYEHFIEGNPVSINSVMGRSSVLRAIRFDETLTNGEDYLYFATLARMGYTYRTINARAATYRIHRGSVTHGNFHTHNAGVQRVQAWIAADMTWHPYLDRRTACTVDPKILETKRVQRDMQALLHCVLAGTAHQVRQVKQAIESAIAADVQSSTYAAVAPDVKVDMIERWAVRALVLPFGSRQLYRASLDCGEVAYNEIILPWEGLPDLRGKIADRFSAYFRRCSKEALGAGDAYEKKARIQHDRQMASASRTGAPSETGVALSPTSQRDFPPVTLDLLSPELAPRWSFLNAGVSGISAGVLNVDRAGGAYAAFASFAFTDADAHAYDAVVTVSELTGSLDLRMGGRMVTQIKAPGEVRVRLSTKDLAPLDLMPSNKLQAAARIVRFALDPVAERSRRTG